MVALAHLTTAHRAHDNRFYGRESKSLLDAGYKVYIIAPHDKDELSQGIEIIALSKVSNRTSRFLYTLFQIAFKSIKLNVDVYHFHDPDLIIVGLFLKIFGKKVVYDVHEDYPVQILHKTWIPSAVRPLIAYIFNIYEKLSSYYFDGIVAATPLIASRFKHSNIATVPNYPILSELFSANLDEYALRPFHIVYAGQITESRGIIEMINTIGILKDTHNVTLKLLGTFKCSIEIEKRVRASNGWSNVDFAGWINRDEIGKIMSTSRIGLVLLHPLENYLESYPAKLFDYMAAGLPVIASNFPLWQEIVNSANCGLTVDPLNIDEIASAIKWLLDNPEEAAQMGLNGQSAAKEHYNWEISSVRLISLYRKIAPVS